MNKSPRTFAVLLLAAVAFYCDDTFNPNGQFSEKIVVYAVMTTESDTQYVLVHKTYPSVTRPVTNTNVLDALVTVKLDSIVYDFRDTSLLRPDSLRISAYVSHGLQLIAGRHYDLTVFSPTLGRVTASAVALHRGVLIKEVDPNGNTLVRIFPGSNARAHVLRQFLEYDVRIDTTWIRKRIEIPKRDEVTGKLIYPKPVSRDVRTVFFSLAGYNAITTQLRQRHSGNTLRLGRTIFVLTELDSALYAYYSTANGFPDSGTLRLDEPNYTNIEGGLGIFAMTSTTIDVGTSALQSRSQTSVSHQQSR